MPKRIRTHGDEFDFILEILFVKFDLGLTSALLL